MGSFFKVKDPIPVEHQSDFVYAYKPNGACMRVKQRFGSNLGSTNTGIPTKNQLSIGIYGKTG